MDQEESAATNNQPPERIPQIDYEFCSKHANRKKIPNATTKCPSFTAKPVYKQRRGYKIPRKYFTVIVYAWLMMNIDPAYPQRARNSMQAAGLIRRSFVSPFSFPSSRGSQNNGLSAVEAVALIHAMNNNGRQSNVGDLEHLMDRSKTPSTRQNLLMRQMIPQQSGSGLMQRQQTGLDRQVPVPVPVPLPAPIAAVVAALAAFAAAVLAGFPPIAALAVALVAALAAVAAAALLAILAILALAPGKKQAPIIKKLVIKKTVLPFVIPIPFKKKEKEVIYKYIPKPIHIHHEEKKKKTNHYHIKMKKSDDLVDEGSTQRSRKENGRLEKIQSLLSEQDRIQMLVDNIVKNKSSREDPSSSLIADIEVEKRTGVLTEKKLHQ